MAVTKFAKFLPWIQAPLYVFLVIFFQQHEGFHTIRLVKPRLTLFTLVFSRFGGSSDVGLREKNLGELSFWWSPIWHLEKGNDRNDRIPSNPFSGAHFLVSLREGSNYIIMIIIIKLDETYIWFRTAFNLNNKVSQCFPQPHQPHLQAFR